ncbi:MAG: M20/M25/M40 family metallo-hydrolase [Planctomycetaceae bacterium]
MPRRLFRFASLSLLPVLFCAAAVGTLAVRAHADTATIAAEATQARLRGDVRHLASDELEGRGVGTKGIDLAAEFIRREFAAAGLDVERMDGGAWQKFTMLSETKLGEPNLLAFEAAEGEMIELKLGEDFEVCSFGGSGTFATGVAFVGYAIESNDPEYDDFAGLDVKGKAVVIVRRTPRQGADDSPFAGPHGSLSRHASLRAKIANAYSKGAAAILFVNDPYSSREIREKHAARKAQADEKIVAAAEKLVEVDPEDAPALVEARNMLAPLFDQRRRLASQGEKLEDDPLMTFGYGTDDENRSTPIFHISQKACDRLLAAAGKPTLRELEARIDTTSKPASFVIPEWKAAGTSSVERIQAEVKNVIGVLEGEGPYADETIVIGAHYDHVGLGGVGSLSPGVKAVHNGADDNASGTAALIELARRFAAREEKPARRLVFIAFTGEERGLVGSAKYVKEPLFPLEKTVAMLNMDMVGRLKDEKLTVFGSGTSPRWEPMLKRLADAGGFQLTLRPSGVGPSDHTSFYTRDIPVLHFFTGSHSDYHRPSDDWEKVNFDGIARVADMVEAIVLDTANQAERPEFARTKQAGDAPREGSRPYFGSIPDFGTDAEGYAISGVVKDSPAEQAGIREGDLLVQLGPHKIGNLSDFDLALRKFAPGDDVPVKVLREGKEVLLKVTLTKPR